MKRYMIILLAAMSMYSAAMAQNSDQSVLGAKVDIQSFEYHADSVKLNIVYNFEDLKIGTNESVVFTPNIYKGENSLALPTVVVKRRGGARSYNRAMALDNSKSIEMYDNLFGTPHQVISFYGKDKQYKVPYSVTVPYQQWMAESQLYVSCTTCGCCNTEDNGMLVPQNNALRIEIPNVEIFHAKPEVKLVKPERVAVKRREIQYSSALIFRVNSTYIDPNLGNNKEELASIDKMMKSVISDSDYTITKVNIIGHASPEGTLAANMKLSEGRAGALKGLMEREYKMIKPELYRVKFGGENWDKLYEIVEQSDLDDRVEILNIIKNTAIEDGREYKLMVLNGGTTYKYLLRNIFPATRLVVVDVEYNIDAYDLDRIAELIDTKPQNLSLEEMYRLSETYHIEDEEFEKIFLTAAKIYPDDEIALNNALVTEIQRDNIAAVKNLAWSIHKDTKSAELANSLGAYYMLAGNYDIAKTMFQRAKELGNSQAEYNMTLLTKKMENVQAIKESEALKTKIYGK